jgi:tripartite-type tricarboxylate transporter receptor subunit TctC
MKCRILPALAVVAMAWPCLVQAQGSFPTKPVRLVVPFPPGGGTDITARAVGLRLTESFGQPVIVDNRPGANGTIGVDLTAKSAPDGYTITMISSSHAVNVGLYPKLPYDLLKDLAPITQATSQPYAFVIYPGVPAKTVKEFIAYAKAKPGTVNYGSSGTGGISHLGGAWFAQLAGIDMVHIPYKGGAPATLDMIAGRNHMQLGTFLLTGAHIKAGRLRVLAVTTPKRWHGTPDLPTVQESGVPGFAITQWYGMLAPAKTPPAIVARLNKEIARVLHLPDVKDKLVADGADPVGGPAADFGAHVKSEVVKYAKIVKQVGLKVE